MPVNVPKCSLSWWLRSQRSAQRPTVPTIFARKRLKRPSEFAPRWYGSTVVHKLRVPVECNGTRGWERSDVRMQAYTRFGLGLGSKVLGAIAQLCFHAARTIARRVYVRWGRHRQDAIIVLSSEGQRLPLPLLRASPPNRSDIPKGNIARHAIGDAVNSSDHVRNGRRLELLRMFVDQVLERSSTKTSMKPCRTGGIFCTIKALNS